jgi:chaperonin GroES
VEEYALALALRQCQRFRQILVRGDPSMKLRPLQDRVLVRRVEPEVKTAGGIFIPDTAQEKPTEGEVVAVGPGMRDEAGNVHPLDVRSGDRVLFGKWSGTEVRLDGEDLMIMKETDIMGVLDRAVAAKKAA